MQDKKLQEKFLKLITVNQNIIHKICYLYGKTLEEREDLYQEIILQLWKSYPRFKNRSCFSTWMYKVALNTALTKTRKPSLFADVEIRSIIEEEVNEFQQNNNEDIQILYKAIGMLKEVEKAIILLWLEEKSYDEIADTIGISVKNVSVKLVRIKSKLANLIEKIQ